MKREAEKSANRRVQRTDRGFSLIELLIVVAIILVIAAIAIPNYVRSKMLANEAAAVQNSRNIMTAEVAYSSTYGIGYSANMAYLGSTGPAGPTAAGLIDDVLATGTKTGYKYTYTPGTPDGSGHYQSFTLQANPLTLGSTGQRYFFTDQTGVIRQNTSAAAGATDPPIS